jgi:hypothetical protein
MESELVLLTRLAEVHVTSLMIQFGSDDGNRVMLE